MPKITNNHPTAPQGLNTKTGVVYLKPGESRDLDLDDVEMERAKELPFFGIEAVDRGSPKSTNPIPPRNGTEANDRDDLKKQADELGIDYARNIPTDKLKELIDAKLAE